MPPLPCSLLQPTSYISACSLPRTIHFFIFSSHPLPGLELSRSYFLFLLLFTSYAPEISPLSQFPLLSSRSAVYLKIIPFIFFFLVPFPIYNHISLIIFPPLPCTGVRAPPYNSRWTRHNFGRVWSILCHEEHAAQVLPKMFPRFWRPSEAMHGDKKCQKGKKNVCI